MPPNKYIIIDVNGTKFLIFMRMNYHKEIFALCEKYISAHTCDTHTCDTHTCVNPKILGGGLWSIKPENKTLTFFSESYDYGRPSDEDLEECINNKNIFNHPSDIDDISEFIDWTFNYSY
jgi:hypothetical protein